MTVSEDLKMEITFIRPNMSDRGADRSRVSGPLRLQQPQFNRSAGLRLQDQYAVS